MLAAFYLIAKVPESPRWLFQKERKEEFIKAVHSIANFNGCPGLIDLTQFSQEYDEITGIFDGDRKTFGQGNVERKSTLLVERASAIRGTTARYTSTHQSKGAYNR